MSEQQTQNAHLPIDAWVDILLLASRDMNISVSSELVRNAATWSAGHDKTDTIIDIAYASGLDAQFISVDIDSISEAMLPFILPLNDALGFVTAINKETLTAHFCAANSFFERQISIRDFSDKSKIDILLLSRHQRVRGDRLETYIEKKPESWLRGIFASNWTIIGQLCLGSLFGNLLAIGTSLFAMQVWDRVIPGRSINTLWVLASGVAIALLLDLFMKTARVAVTDHFGKQADLKLSAMFYARTLNIRNDARPRSPGTLIAQLRDLDQMRELLTSSTLGVLIDLPFVLVFLFIIWLLGGPLVWVPIAAIPLIILPGVLLQIPLAKLSNQGMDESMLRNAILMESIYRAEDIKLLQAEPRFRRLWNEVNKVNGDISLKQRRIASFLMNFSQMIQQFAYIGVIIVGVYGILDSQLSFGAVLACSILTSRTIAPLAQVPAVLGRLQNARVGKKALDGLLTLPVDHDANTDYYHKPNIRGNYSFENVLYGYGPEEKPALIIPKLKIKAGEKIAVLGRVGAGKSTFLRMLSGLSSPIQGQVQLDGTPLKMVDIADIRRDVGAVLQESSLFYGTLRDNLLIANPLANDEQLLEALKLTCADQLVLNQPHGLDLKLRESGVGLSGGQKQAILLSRLYLRAPNTLLLDEPTASLDEATELSVLEHMKNWLGDRTLIVATHRYPVLSLVDRIIMIENGRIVRDGPKDVLLSNLKTVPTPNQTDDVQKRRPAPRKV
ncbi:type I secretion system permease/ATPase [Bartonella tamiae]|uniref:Type I secretion system ATPase n=1 Tax=Bartonella tamiae Th239 TaxID=1094558 RepID=J1JXD1_9HYPH|nr:type I secretion system permease/ATPase [Bartonella tamiae]EJF89275.1 type I secretion system ATPase [Bartonella tamiae Th239]EJF95563.1 type I secretion system ATPase [Bartonella tamiae Th307]